MSVATETHWCGWCETHPERGYSQDASAFTDSHLISSSKQRSAALIYASPTGGHMHVHEVVIAGMGSSAAAAAIRADRWKWRWVRAVQEFRPDYRPPKFLNASSWVQVGPPTKPRRFARTRRNVQAWLAKRRRS